MEEIGGLPLDQIPILLVKDIIKKMKLKSVIRLQKSAKWCDLLVQGCHSPILDRCQRVVQRKSKENPWTGAQNEIRFIEFTLRAQKKLYSELLKLDEKSRKVKLKDSKAIVHLYQDFYYVWKAIFDPNYS